MNHLESLGYKTFPEYYFVKAPEEVKNRFADIVGVNTATEQAIVINIGNVTNKGIPVMRERRALVDIYLSPAFANLEYPVLYFIGSE